MELQLGLSSGSARQRLRELASRVPKYLMTYFAGGVGAGNDGATETTGTGRGNDSVVQMEGLKPGFITDRLKGSNGIRKTVHSCGTLHDQGSFWHRPEEARCESVVRASARMSDPTSARVTRGADSGLRRLALNQ
jgi:hypothetical protein